MQIEVNVKNPTAAFLATLAGFVPPIDGVDEPAPALAPLVGKFKEPESAGEPVKRGRGRPVKAQMAEAVDAALDRGATVVLEPKADGNVAMGTKIETQAELLPEAPAEVIVAAVVPKWASAREALQAVNVAYGAGGLNKIGELLGTFNNADGKPARRQGEIQPSDMEKFYAACEAAIKTSGAIAPVALA